MHHTALFLNHTSDRSPPVDNGFFDAVAYLATCMIGAAGVGIVLISTMGCHLRTSRPIFAMPIRRSKGRIGRRPRAGHHTDHYVLYGWLKSYIQPVGAPLAIGVPEDLDQTNADSAMELDHYRTYCIDKLLDVLDLFVLANNGLHSLLAHCLANLYLLIPEGALQPSCPNDGPQYSYCS